MKLLTDFPQYFFELEEIFILFPDKKQPHKKMSIESARPHKGAVLLKIKDIENPDQAESLRGANITIPIEDTIPPDEDEYFVDEIIGMQVFSGEILVGEVCNILSAGYHDVYEVVHPDSKKINLIPAVKSFISQVNLEEGRILIQSIPGLVEL